MGWLRAAGHWIERHSRAVALAIWLTLLLMLLIGISVNLLIRMDYISGVKVELLEIILGIGFFAIPTFGALIVARMPRNAIGWIFCLIGFMTLSPADLYTKVAFAHQWPLANWVLWFDSFVDVTDLLGLLLVVPHIFPDGRLVSRRWRPLLLLSIAVILGIMLNQGFTPKTISTESGNVTVPNPARTAALASVMDVVRPLWVIVLPLALVGSLTSLGLRFRRSRGIERLQLRWLLWMLGIVISALVTLLLGTTLAPSIFRIDDGLTLPALILGAIVLVGGGIGIPSVIGLAILRYRLYSVDLLVNRTLVYGALSLGLGAVYVVCVVLFQRALEPVTPNSSLAVAGSTLAVAALFQPLRRRIQGTVDRHFYRRKYDAARTIEALSMRLRDEIDLDTLRAELCSVVQETMQPVSVSLWLRTPRSPST